MKYYWEVRWIIMLGFAKCERFVARCVNVEFLSQIRKQFTLLRLFTWHVPSERPIVRVIKYEDTMVMVGCKFQLQSKPLQHDLQCVHIPTAFELVQYHIPYAAFIQSEGNFLIPTSRRLRKWIRNFKIIVFLCFTREILAPNAVQNIFIFLKYLIMYSSTYRE